MGKHKKRLRRNSYKANKYFNTGLKYNRGDIRLSAVERKVVDAVNDCLENVLHVQKQMHRASRQNFLDKLIENLADVFDKTSIQNTANASNTSIDVGIIVSAIKKLITDENSKQHKELSEYLSGISWNDKIETQLIEMLKASLSIQQKKSHTTTSTDSTTQNTHTVGTSIEQQPATDQTTDVKTDTETLTSSTNTSNVVVKNSEQQRDRNVNDSINQLNKFKSFADKNKLDSNKEVKNLDDKPHSSKTVSGGNKSLTASTDTTAKTDNKGAPTPDNPTTLFKIQHTVKVFGKNLLKNTKFIMGKSIKTVLLFPFKTANLFYNTFFKKASTKRGRFFQMLMQLFLTNKRVLFWTTVFVTLWFKTAFAFVNEIRKYLLSDKLSTTANKLNTKWTGFKQMIMDKCTAFKNVLDSHEEFFSVVTFLIKNAATIGFVSAIVQTIVDHYVKKWIARGATKALTTVTARAGSWALQVGVRALPVLGNPVTLAVAAVIAAAVLVGWGLYEQYQNKNARHTSPVAHAINTDFNTAIYDKDTGYTEFTHGADDTGTLSFSISSKNAINNVLLPHAKDAFTTAQKNTTGIYDHLFDNKDRTKLTNSGRIELTKRLIKNSLLSRRSAPGEVMEKYLWPIFGNHFKGKPWGDFLELVNSLWDNLTTNNCVYKANGDVDESNYKKILRKIILLNRAHQLFNEFMINDETGVLNTAIGLKKAILYGHYKGKVTEALYTAYKQYVVDEIARLDLSDDLEEVVKNGDEKKYFNIHHALQQVFRVVSNSYLLYSRSHKPSSKNRPNDEYIWINPPMPYSHLRWTAGTKETEGKAGVFWQQDRKKGKGLSNYDTLFDYVYGVDLRPDEKNKDDFSNLNEYYIQYPAFKNTNGEKNWLSINPLLMANGIGFARAEKGKYAPVRFYQLADYAWNGSREAVLNTSGGSAVRLSISDHSLLNLTRQFITDEKLLEGIEDINDLRRTDQLETIINTISGSYHTPYSGGFINPNDVLLLKTVLLEFLQRLSEEQF